MGHDGLRRRDISCAPEARYRPGRGIVGRLGHAARSLQKLVWHVPCFRWNPFLMNCFGTPPSVVGQHSPVEDNHEHRATLNPDAISYVCSLVRQRSAIELDAAKAYLIEARLNPLARGTDFRRRPT